MSKMETQLHVKVQRENTFGDVGLQICSEYYFILDMVRYSKSTVWGYNFAEMQTRWRDIFWLKRILNLSVDYLLVVLNRN